MFQWILSTQIPHEPVRERIRAATVTGRKLTLCTQISCHLHGPEGDYKQTAYVEM